MSFEKRTLGARARGSAILVAALTWSCGPEHGGGGGGGSGGDAGDAGSGAGPSAGTGGAGAASSSGTDAGGSAAGSSTAGSGGTGGPGAEPVIGCPAASWPDAGFFYEPPPASGEPDSASIILNQFSALEMSGNGKVVVGMSRNPDSENPRPVPAAFTLEGSAVLLASAPPSGESYPRLASCDGSVVVQQELFFGAIFRTEGDEVVPLFTYGADYQTLSMDPTGARIVDGTGQGSYSDETGPIPPVPQEWTAATGTVWLTALTDERLYHVSPNGDLIGADADALFRYDRASSTREPIGMAPVSGGSSIVVSANGNAWIESADTHFDSFLAWRPPAEPRSVTCPATCMPLDLSSTGEVALLDVTLDASNFGSSFVWTERRGLVDLTSLFGELGFDLGGRKLHAVAMSDDARAFAGYTFDPTVSYPGPRFFYAVLPVAAYQ